MTPLQLGVNVFPPMHISSRLMAALTIDGAGTLHLEATGRMAGEGRLSYRLVIEDADGTELLDQYKALESEAGAEVDHLGMVQAALSFLTGAAEDWAPRMQAGRLDGDEPPYPASVIEWADRHRTQLDAAAEPLDNWRELATNRDARVFFTAYIETALWSSTDNADDSGGEPLDANYTPADLAQAALDEMLDDCIQFLIDSDNERDLAAASEQHGYSIKQAGSDFWLTRNGHGAGFWDRGLGEVGDRLTKAAKVYGSSDLYVGDDGKLYV